MPTSSADDIVLQHIIVVAGQASEWPTIDDTAWHERLVEWGAVADHVGARWLVVRPYEAGAQPGVSPHPQPARTAQSGHCSVVAHPDADGRDRFVRAVATLHADGVEITEDSIDAVLNAPATVDPDLVVVLGPSHQMPPSLVWELAYSELVFVDCDWRTFGRQQLDEAISSFAQRHRRFGGVDD